MVKVRREKKVEIKLGGFLGDMLTWSVCNPKFGVVEGPIYETA
jgi:hypothetical protein